MKKLFTILFISFFISNSKAQIAKIFANEFPDSASSRFGITGDYDINSNAITNAFTNKFYTGGYIDDNLKNSVLNRVKNDNRLGGNANAGIYAAFKLASFCNKKNMSIFFSVRDRVHLDARFSKDLFNVGFYGNAQYAGTTADLSNFNLNLIHYQQIQVGIFSSKSTNSVRWGLGISFLNGQQDLSILAKKAELFTSADGQYMNLNTQLSAAKSDTANKGTGAFNGYGASIDLFFEAPIQTRFGNSKITVSASDIGAIRFNKQSMTLNQDSTLQYSGIKINNISDIQNSAFGSNAKDSVINSVAPFKKHAYTVTIPSVFNIAFETQFSNYFHLTEGVRYVFNGNYNLLMYLSGNFYLNSKLILSSTFGYGGYGTFNYGMGISAKLGKNFVVHAGSNNIEGFIVPKKTTGQGAYVSLVKKFK